MHERAREVVEAARALGLEVAVTEFGEATRTAEDAARAIGCRVAQIVKSLVFGAGDAVVMALVAGDNRLDEKRLALAAGVEHTSRVDADAVRAATGFAIGGVPPFGHTTSLETYLDRDLLAHDVVWAAAGTPNTVFPIAPTDLVRVTGASVCDLRREG